MIGKFLTKDIEENEFSTQQKSIGTYLNTKHKNIKFTYEKQIDDKLPFLDILISNNENLQTSVFHKKTYTGLLLILALLQILISMASLRH